MGDGGEYPLRATDNERYSVSGGSTSENRENSTGLLEAKQERRKKKEASFPDLGLERSLRSGQEPPPARTGAPYACTPRPVLSQSKNLLLLCRMTRDLEERKCKVGEKG